MTEASEPKGHTDIGISAETKELKRNTHIAEEIVGRLDNYIEKGRLGLGERMERGHTYSGKRDKESSLCGHASEYVIEIVNEIRQDNPQIVARAFQAQLLQAVIPKGIDHEEFPSFLRHGFNIVIEQKKKKWWIIDRTLSQIIEKTDDGGLKFGISGIKVDKNSDYYPSVVAHTMSEKGYVEGNPKNLAAFIALMAGYRFKKSFYNKLLDRFRNKETFIDSLGKMRTSGVKNNTAGDWTAATRELRRK